MEVLQNSSAKTLARKAPSERLQFGEDRSFQVELRRRVDDFFKSSGRPQVDNWQMYVKSIIILAWFLTSYVLLVFVSRSVWTGVPCAVFLGLTMAGIGFCIQHDGGHNAYSKQRWINKLAARTLDLIGGSSYVWHFKHAVIHHTYANITGWDTDIDFGNLAHITPHQKRLPFHRWQHLYLWPLYGFLAIKWQLFDDFQYIVTGRLGRHRIPRPRRKDLAIFIAGKVVFFTWVFAIPLLFHPFLVVLFYYSVAVLVLGTVLSMIFLLPHCVGQADFPLPVNNTRRMEKPWAVHQAEVTLDFAQSNRAATWFLGGLNYHLEHHLFPTICHVNYPAISKIVWETCREFRVPYGVHHSFLYGLASHYRWLKQMGMPGKGTSMEAAAQKKGDDR
jgi:linoleoyl-CoA desaturase